MTEINEKGPASAGIAFRGRSATKLFHELLLDAQSTFPAEFESAPIPKSPTVFRKRFPDLLTQFEALRQRSEQRTEIARHIVQASASAFVLPKDGGKRPLAEALREEGKPLPLESRQFPGQPGIRPGVRIGGRRHDGDALGTFLDTLHSAGQMTGAARNALHWVIGRAEQSPQGIDLSGRRVAVLGAGAALAPVELLLQGGAEVLWLDLRGPDAALSRREDLAGSLHWPSAGADLIAEPCQVLRTIETFAAEGPVDLCLFAYAPGRGREWLLTASMNAIVHALPREAVSSLSLFISPASPLRLTADEVARAERQRRGAPIWKKSMAGLGLLGRGTGHHAEGPVAVSRAVISMQGACYQAAQYIDKILAAETWSTWGAPNDPLPAPFHVSANTAAITATPSMQKPVFEVAFRGAPAFDIDIFEPSTTKDLNGLLMLRDWLDPASPGNPARDFARALDRIEAMDAIKIHGGAHGIAYPAEPTIRMSALVSLARHPGQLLRLMRGR
ncbi:MAG TPA: hypothetical protein PKZ35_18000 [Gammaproteobacteria bacterium]|nr:hypothetical protein [Gammaproteobacteria bacterium]